MSEPLPAEPLPAEPLPAEPLPAVEPRPSPDNAPFWEAAAESKLVLARCKRCSTYIWYPRTHCPACHAAEVEWVAASGRGTVYSFTVSARGSGPWAGFAPYVIAYVELEEGPRVLTNVVGVDPAAVRIGQPVEAVFEPAGETRVLRFKPAPG